MEFTEYFNPKKCCKFKFEFEPRFEIGELVTCYEEHKFNEPDYVILRITGYKLDVSEGFCPEICVTYYAEFVDHASPSKDAQLCFFHEYDDSFDIPDIGCFNWSGGNFYVKEDDGDWKKIQ